MWAPRLASFLDYETSFARKVDLVVIFMAVFIYSSVGVASRRKTFAQVEEFVRSLRADCRSPGIVNKLSTVLTIVTNWGRRGGCWGALKGDRDGFGGYCLSNVSGDPKSCLETGKSLDQGGNGD